jgi:hypothetical protein
MEITQPLALEIREQLLRQPTKSRALYANADFCGTSDVTRPFGFLVHPRGELAAAVARNATNVVAAVASLKNVHMPWSPPAS